MSYKREFLPGHGEPGPILFLAATGRNKDSPVSREDEGLRGPGFDAQDKVQESEQLPDRRLGRSKQDQLKARADAILARVLAHDRRHPAEED